MVAAWKKRLPMQFTLARIFLTAPIVFCLIPNTFEWNLAAAVLFFFASITDYYDGYFARKYKAVSTMGKFMDPIADKILVSSILIMLVVPGKIDPYLVILLIVRDTFIGGIRSVAAADGVIIDAKSAGKWKTAMQMAGIPLVMLWTLPFLPALDPWVGRSGYILLWVSAVLSISSGVEYYRAYLEGRKDV